MLVMVKSIFHTFFFIHNANVVVWYQMVCTCIYVSHFFAETTDGFVVKTKGDINIKRLYAFIVYSLWSVSEEGFFVSRRL